MLRCEVNAPNCAAQRPVLIAGRENPYQKEVMARLAFPKCPDNLPLLGPANLAGDFVKQGAGGERGDTWTERTRT